jgi:hypothetical protein
MSVSVLQDMVIERNPRFVFKFKDAVETVEKGLGYIMGFFLFLK